MKANEKGLTRKVYFLRYATLERLGSMRSKQAKAVPGGSPRDTARDMVAQIPLREIFQNQELADAFLSELMLAIARESSRSDIMERQRKGIAEAKARGVRFGKPARELPENFEDVRQSWREGWLSLKQAAEECGLPESTFYYAAQRAEGIARKPGKAAEPETEVS